LETICHNASMCGRYRLSRRKELRESFDAYGEYDDAPRYNIAPSQPVLSIRQEPSSPRRSFSTMRWGLIPSWAKDPTIGFRTINARSETVTTMPSFREPFKSQRCLIPADGFYEWLRHEATNTIVWQEIDQTRCSISGTLRGRAILRGVVQKLSNNESYHTWISKPRGAGISASIEADRG
jgi:putative SOS response-associated peptidase YedK